MFTSKSISQSDEENGQSPQVLKLSKNLLVWKCVHSCSSWWWTLNNFVIWLLFNLRPFVVMFMRNSIA